MTRRSPEPPQPPADSVSGVEAPSAAAELEIVLFQPSGGSPDKVPARQEIQAAGNPVSRLVTRVRRAGLHVRAGMTVPAEHTGEMLSFCNNVGLAAIWGLTAVLTLAIMATASMPVSTIVVIIAIELAGFVSALLLRRKRQPR